MTTPDDAGTPAPDDTPRYGQRAPQPPEGTVPPGAPQYGQPGQYGQPAQPGAQPGQPVPNAWGQPQYGQPGQYGQQGQYGAPQYGAPVQPGYGPPAFAGMPYAPPANKPGIIPLRPLTLGEIFDGAFGAIRSNPKVMLGMSATVIAIATILGMALGALVSGIFAPQLAQLETELGSDVQVLTDMLPLLGASLVTGVVLALALPIVNGILITSVGQSVIGRKATVGEVWAQVRSKVWPLIGFSFLSNLVVYVATFLYVLLTILGFTVGVGLGIVLLLLGLAGLVAFLAWFIVRTLLIPPALVLEGQGFRSAVVRGWTLTRGAYWRTLGISLLAYIAVSVIASIVVYPFSAITTFLVTDTFGVLALTAVAQIISSVVTSVFLAGVVSLLYIDVRMRREGLDVELTAAANEHAEHGTA
ncbi:glycerophosphoryl diester phosphodiesterase membrane domain-containing protein [Oerskovia enterophila]